MNRNPPVIDMTLDGAFRTPPRVAAGVPLSFKVLVGAVLVAVMAGATAMAALAIWVASLLLPVLIVAAGVAWAMVHYRRWQALRGGRGLNLR